MTANHRVKQIVEVVEPNDKERRLAQLLKEYHKGQKEGLLIFALYKKEAARLEGYVQRLGYPNTAAIHGESAPLRGEQRGLERAQLWAGDTH